MRKTWTDKQNVETTKNNVKDLSRHCLPMRPGSCFEIFDHLGLSFSG